MGSASSKAHGIIMVLGWVGCSSVGQMTSKHYRDSFPKRKIAGRDFWFASHFACMVACVLLTIIAFIIIYVKEGKQETNAHSVLGLIVGILAFLQPIGGLLRPGPGSRFRIWFNYGHWFAGNVIHLLAIVNMYLALPFRTISEKEGYVYVLTAYVLLHMLTDFLLTKLPKNAPSPPGGVIDVALNKIASAAADGDAEKAAKASDKPSLEKKLIEARPKITKRILIGYLGILAFLVFMLCLIVGNAGVFDRSH